MATLSDWLSKHDMSDAAFAALIGVERGSVGRYTRGERFPDPPTLSAIRQVTGGEVTAADMLETWETANPGRVPVIEGPYEGTASRAASAAGAAS